MITTKMMIIATKVEKRYQQVMIKMPKATIGDNNDVKNYNKSYKNCNNNDKQDNNDRQNPRQGSGVKVRQVTNRVLFENLINACQHPSVVPTTKDEIIYCLLLKIKFQYFVLQSSNTEASFDSDVATIQLP